MLGTKMKREENEVATAGKSSSVVLIKSLEGINKELIYQQRVNRPFNVVQNLPIAKDKDSLPDYSTLQNPLSIKDTSVLYTSLIVSRFNWLNHIFNTYWTKREQLIVGANTYKKDKMVRLCDAEFFCGVHTFSVKLFFIKDDEKEQAFKEELEKKKEEKIRKKQEKLEEIQRKKLLKEKDEKEKKELKEKIDGGNAFIVNAESKNFNVVNDSTIDKNIVTDRTAKINNSNDADETSKNVSNLNVQQPQINPTVIKGTTQNETVTIKNELPVSAKNTVLNGIPKKLPIKPLEKKSFEEQSSNKQSDFITLKISNKEKSQMKESVKTTVVTSKTEAPITKSKAATKVLLSNPENAIMIQNLNFLAKNDTYLNNLMRDVAGGGARPEQIAEFQKYIQKAKAMGDLKKLSNKSKTSESRTNVPVAEDGKDKMKKQRTDISKNGENKKTVPLTPEEAKRKEEELFKRVAQLKAEQEQQRKEKQRLKEEKEREKLMLREERERKKMIEKEEREKVKEALKKQKETERELKKQMRIAEKEKLMQERQQKQKERQLQKEREKSDQKFKTESKKYKNGDSLEIDYDESNDDRLAKLSNTELSEDLWNDKLSPLQERYSKSANLIFEFTENNAARFEIPKDCIFELIENDEEAEINGGLNKIINKDSEDSGSSFSDSMKKEGMDTLPKSPYVTILASFLLVHNDKEIRGWERRQEEAVKAKEENERKIKAEDDNDDNLNIAERKRKRKSAKTWGSSKRATRATKQAKKLESLRREEENYFEEDDELRNGELGESALDVKPTPVYSPLTIKLSKIPFRFADFITNSGNSPDESRENMKHVMSIGKRVEFDQLWYQVDGIKDEFLAETLRYNLNRLDYTNSSLKKGKMIFQKKFGKGGRNN